ncbi:toll/interleukin-1 receptor domain-containing protein [Cystobacter fuscus]
MFVVPVVTAGRSPSTAMMSNEFNGDPVAHPHSVNLFYSYSHRDEELRAELDGHLSLLRRRGVLRTWCDRRITAGDDWRNSIDEHLMTADIVLLLVSADFMNSDYCHDREMSVALQRHENGECVVIPVLVRHLDWEGQVLTSQVASHQHSTCHELAEPR